MLEKALVVAGVAATLMAPSFVTVVSRQSWALWLKRIVALGLILPFLAVMVYVIIMPLPVGSNVPESLVDGFVVLYLGWTLFRVFHAWPRAGGRPELTKDVRGLVDTAVAAAELQLGLTAMKRLERPNPPEGVYSHHLARYSDGTWLEWLNPSDEKGKPVLSTYALYSNNKALVRVLAKALAPSCNVERTDRPLWRDAE